MYLPVLALFAEEAHAELFMPAEWFGIIMFILLMLALLLTVSFSNKGKELPAESHH